MTDSAQPSSSAPDANSLWGGRFAAGPAAIMERINASIGFDRKLYAQDIAGSKAHAAMLARQGIIGADDAASISAGLDQVLAEIESGVFPFKVALEDIHMNVEARLAELIGEPAKRLHTGRSRNDQVATDFKLWVRDAFDRLDAGLKDLQAALIEQAERLDDSELVHFLAVAQLLVEERAASLNSGLAIFDDVDTRLPH